MSLRSKMMLAGVPKSARRLISMMEADAARDPQMIVRIRSRAGISTEDHVAIIFGAFLNPGSNVAGVAITATPSALAIVDAGTAYPLVECSWNQLIRFDVKNDGLYQVVGFNIYDGPQPIAERLALSTPLRPNEMSGGHCYMRAPMDFLSFVSGQLETLGVPNEAHLVPRLV